MIACLTAFSKSRLTTPTSPSPGPVRRSLTGMGPWRARRSATALRAITSDKPHMASLDVQMPELGGVEVVRSVLSTELPGVVFVTAFDRYALRPFDEHAIDDLLKPFTRKRFRTALSRAREFSITPEQSPNGGRVISCA
jgi:two-component SAPR family response regulator